MKYFVPLSLALRGEDERDGAFGVDLIDVGVRVI
jgi:hypothetical protein